MKGINFVNMSCVPLNIYQHTLSRTLFQTAAKIEKKWDELHQNPHKDVKLIEYPLRKRITSGSSMTLFKEDKAKAKQKKTKIHGSLTQQAHDFGFIMQNVGGDGRCFFHALIKQLHNHNLYKNLTLDNLIDISIRHMQLNKTFYEPFISEAKDLDTYLDNLRNNTTWPAHIVLIALAVELNLNMAILQSDGESPIVIKTPNTIATLYFAYEVDCHYQILLPDPTANPKKNIQDYIDATPYNESYPDKIFDFKQFFGLRR